MQSLQENSPTVNITTGFAGREQTIIDLFAATFTAWEGADEGALIGGLVSDLLADTPSADIHVFCAEEAGQVIGAAAFTRLTYPEDASRSVVLLSPMAVVTDRQRQGVGQVLLTHALAALSSEGVDVVVTYGDPDYYGRVGFVPITEDQARAPLPLSLPHGWLGQSLTGRQMAALRGPSTCVSALNRADVW
jgi:putative acetyltransferase